MIRMSGSFMEISKEKIGTEKRDPRGLDYDKVLDKRKSLRCFEHDSIEHLRQTWCPKLKVLVASNSGNNISEGLEVEKFLLSYIFTGSQRCRMQIMKDTGATIDTACRKYAFSRIWRVFQYSNSDYLLGSRNSALMWAGKYYH